LNDLSCQAISDIRKLGRGIIASLRSGRRILTSLTATVMRGGWTRYNVFSGTNTWDEIRITVLGLMGRFPLILGPDIAEYERRFAQATDTKYAFSFASGRMGLYAILEALELSVGDEIIIPAFTCVVVPNALIYKGVRPVYAEIDPETYNIDVSKLESRVTPKTRAIIAQHTFGLVCDIEGILEIAERHKLIVIEDCAHALGATHKGRKVGSLGLTAYFSTDHSKVISTSTGGMVVTNDSALASKMAQLQDKTPFLRKKYVRKILWTFVIEYCLFHPRVCLIGSYIHSWLGNRGRLGYFLDELELAKPTEYPYPARLSNVQAMIGIRQLDKLSENIGWRRTLAGLYDDEMKCKQEFLGKDLTNHVFLRYTFLVEDRDAWQDLMQDVLDMGVWFSSVCQGRDSDLHEVGYEAGSCPIAEHVCKHCVNLPTHPRITKPQLLIRRLREAQRSKDPRLRLSRKSLPNNSTLTE